MSADTEQPATRPIRKLQMVTLPLNAYETTAINVPIPVTAADIRAIRRWCDYIESLEVTP